MVVVRKIGLSLTGVTRTWNELVNESVPSEATKVIVFVPKLLVLRVIGNVRLAPVPATTKLFVATIFVSEE